jgi:hypothetical protein
MLQIRYTLVETAGREIWPLAASLQWGPGRGRAGKSWQHLGAGCRGLLVAVWSWLQTTHLDVQRQCREVLAFVWSWLQ